MARGGRWLGKSAARTKRCSGRRALVARCPRSARALPCARALPALCSLVRWHLVEKKLAEVVPSERRRSSACCFLASPRRYPEKPPSPEPNGSTPAPKVSAADATVSNRRHGLLAGDVCAEYREFSTRMNAGKCRTYRGGNNKELDTAEERDACVGGRDAVVGGRDEGWGEVLHTAEERA